MQGISQFVANSFCDISVTRFLLFNGLLFGNFSNQMQMGQPVPGTGPAVLPGGYPACPAYPDSYSSAGDPMWTYFTAVADQNLIQIINMFYSLQFRNLQNYDCHVGCYSLSPQTLTAIVKRYSKNGRIFFDDYVACCVKLRALTDFFRRRDHLQQGVVSFIYDDLNANVRFNSGRNTNLTL
ncbi:hypothetical protein E2I00_001929 [Balaenoptera physalus]|uniref:Uncharacterized protein n=1 Tax=Balaenoptera physalus TaxID=9770 RepID=A0A643C694_BALPH|nr:hypothetical protein E2I00_001929 [Balaenoptera physalus]